MSVLTAMGIEPEAMPAALVGGGSGALGAALLGVMLHTHRDPTTLRQLLALAGLGGAIGTGVGHGVGMHLYDQRRARARLQDDLQKE